jgi:hypothetical protein
MPARQWLDLTLPTDPRGTCPSCRGANLVYDSLVPFPGPSAHPVYAPAVYCPKCGYICRLEPNQQVAGVSMPSP